MKVNIVHSVHISGFVDSAKGTLASDVVAWASHVTSVVKKL